MVELLAHPCAFLVFHLRKLDFTIDGSMLSGTARRASRSVSPSDLRMIFAVASPFTAQIVVPVVQFQRLVIRQCYQLCLQQELSVNSLTRPLIWGMLFEQKATAAF